MTLAQNPEPTQRHSPPAADNRPCVFPMINELAVGGNEWQYSLLVEALRREGFEVRLGCMRRAGPYVERIGEFAEFDVGGSFFSPKAGLAARRLAQYLRAQRVSVAQSFDFYSNLFMIPVARMAGVPVVLGNMGQIGDLLPPGKRRVQRMVFRLCDRVVCNSQAAADTLIREGFPAGKITVIRNGVPEEAFGDTAPALPPQPGVLRVGMIGRMNNPIKNHALFLRAAARVAQRFPQTEFVLVGDGSLRPELEQLARDLRLAGQTSFLGERHDIPALLASFDISVQPSTSESLSNVILQTMAAGKPVIASHVGGNPEAVEDGETGILFPSGNEEKLTQAIELLLSRPDLRRQWGQRGREAAQVKFTLRRLCDEHQQLYRALLSEKGWRAGKRSAGRVADASRPVRVALVGPALRSVGGQAVQLDLLLRSWRNDAHVAAHFIPINPRFPRGLGWVEHIPYLRTLTRAPLYLTGLWRGLRGIDVAHIFSASYWSFLLGPAPALVIARLRGAQTLINYRSGEAEFHLAHWRTARWFLRRADRIVVPSGYLVDVFRKHGLRAQAVPNVVDQERFCFRLRLPLRPWLVCTRQFEPYYSVDVIVRAFADVKREYPESQLCLVGNGALESQIRELVRQLGLSGVEFVGAVPRDKIGRYYAQSDIFVNASWLDNMPGSILEAFASGTPVVSTAPEAIRYLVEHERTGLLCDPGDWRALAENVLRLLREPNLARRLAENAYQESRRYQWDAVRGQWLQVYRELCWPTTEARGLRNSPIGTRFDADGSEMKTGHTLSRQEEPVAVPRDIICFANDWAADPLSKKQVMVRLARKHRILWINSINNRRPRLAQKDLRRALQKLDQFRKGLQRVDESIWVLAPLYLPFHGLTLVRWLNRRFLRWQIRRALRRLKFESPLTWTYAPTSADVVGTLGEKLIVYHCVDEYAAFSDAAAEVRLRERELIAKSDLVVVCSTALLETKKKENARTYLVTHGVDYDHFRKAVEESTPVAPELRGLQRPILGFHGLIADWVDLPLIAEIARQRPQWTVVLVGPADTDLAPICGLPNVHVLGRRPYSRLPEYLRGFDVALLPFVDNELTVNANPLKLREYLAAGLPVVATPLPEVARLAGSVRLARTVKDYIHEVERILKQGDGGPSRGRSEPMAKESWDHKVEEMEDLVARIRRSSYEQQLRQHPALRDLGLEFVGKFSGRHSELIEYRGCSGRGPASIVVKRTTWCEDAKRAEEAMVREYESLKKVRQMVGPSLAESLPEPFLVVPEEKVLVVSKLPGIPLSRILKRVANRVTGTAQGEAASQVAALGGTWLHGFHEATQQASRPHDPATYLGKLRRQLERCERVGLDQETREMVWEVAQRASRAVEGSPEATAARHGDFMPPNILVDDGRISLTDFENFAECDTVYEDVSAFAAYLAMLAGSPFYSRPAIEAAQERFLASYGVPSRELLNLYVLKASVLTIAELNPRTRGFLRAQRLRWLTAQLRVVARKTEETLAAVR